MTFIMFMLAFGARTPTLMWIVAMLCDTALLCTFLITKAIHP